MSLLILYKTSFKILFSFNKIYILIEYIYKYINKLFEILKKIKKKIQNNKKNNLYYLKNMEKKNMVKFKITLA